MYYIHVHVNQRNVSNLLGRMTLKIALIDNNPFENHFGCLKKRYSACNTCNYIHLRSCFFLKINSIKITLKENLCTQKYPRVYYTMCPLNIPKPGK